MSTSLEWLRQRRRATTLRIRSIPWRRSREWNLADGAFRHRTGGFFSVVGVRATARIPALDGVSQPIIHQPEIGILGFLVTPGQGEWRWLVQAKAEPGNVGVVQLAPTVQATYSNYSRRHGGDPTPYLEHFLESGVAFPNDGAHSEQGLRFWGKFNRNMTRVIDSPLPAVDSHFQWFGAGELRAALRSDYAMNTDARSVIVTSPWRFMAEEERPFAAIARRDSRLAALRDSHAVEVNEDRLAGIRGLVRDLRAASALRVDAIPLEDLDGWRLDAEGIVARRETTDALEFPSTPWMPRNGKRIAGTSPWPVPAKKTG